MIYIHNINDLVASRCFFNNCIFLRKLAVHCNQLRSHYVDFYGLIDSHSQFYPFMGLFVSLQNYHSDYFFNFLEDFSGTIEYDISFVIYWLLSATKIVILNKAFQRIFE